jgi:hypothetical protein
VAVIFAYFHFSVIAFCVDATIKTCELVFEANSFIVATSYKEITIDDFQNPNNF